MGPAFIFTAFWFLYRGHQVNDQWDQQVEEIEVKWKEIDKQTMEMVEAHRKARDRFEKSRIEGEIISLQTEQYTLQRKALKKSQELYYERYDIELDYFILTLIGFLIIQFGLLRSRFRWKRACLAARKTIAEMRAREKDSPSG